LINTLGDVAAELESGFRSLGNIRDLMCSVGSDSGISSGVSRDAATFKEFGSSESGQNQGGFPGYPEVVSAVGTCLKGS